MRPLKLTMQAFGSYGKETVIDFEAANQNLFLITGDTGAGKTTIFDAIVFALYGEASSTANKKDGTELQSQFAGADIKPFVELTFSEGTGPARRLYTVRRVPRHVRPLKRGKGIKEESGSVSLIMDDGTEYPPKETDRKLEEILGLTKGQFMQVAMIAQGEFMELLRAKSDDKKVIFRKLFHTELYQKIIDELARRRKETFQEMGQIRTACQTEVSHLVIPKDHKEAGELSRLRDEILGSEKLSVVAMENLIQSLGQLCDLLKFQESEASSVYEAVNKDYLARRDVLAQARQLSERFEELEKAQEELEQCEAMKASVEELEQKAGQITAAYEISAIYERYADSQKNFKEKNAALAAWRQALPGFEKANREDMEGEQKAQESFNETLSMLTRVSEQVKKALSVFDQAKKAKVQVQKGTKDYKKARELLERLNETMSAIESQEEQRRRQGEELQDAEVDFARWQEKAKKYRELYNDWETLENLEKETKAQKKAVDEARAAYGEASKAYEKKNGEYETARRIFLGAQAGFIAREQLRPGKPCPVCGSLDHPNPCPIEEDYAHLTREGLEQAQQEVQALSKSQEQAATKAQAATAILEEKNTRLETETARLGEKLTADLPTNFRPAQPLTAARVRDTLLEWRQILALEGKTAKDHVKQKQAILQAQKESEEKKKDLFVQIEDARKKTEDIRAALAGYEAALKNLEMSRDFPTEGEAREALEKAEKDKKLAEEKYNQARRKSQRSKSQMEGTRALISRYESELPKDQARLDGCQKDYETVMEEKKLTQDQWQEIVLQYKKSQAALFLEEVNAYHQKKAGAKSRANQAKAAIKDQKRPDISRLEKELETAGEKVSEARSAFDRIREVLRADVNVYNALEPKMSQRAKIVDRHRSMDDLYNLLAGKVSGARMDIETFVQRYYLERILFGANRRFMEMSAGQYELRMKDVDAAGVGKNRGLDLMVYSTVTGKEREVRTLSGGESFMAALSLALGMADQIQAGTASVNLDVMFIDEGFGSLDDHSRDKAVRVLQEMAGGSKMIGIISHVTELKQEIEDQLIVEKDEDGSHVRWQIS